MKRAEAVPNLTKEELKVLLVPMYPGSIYHRLTAELDGWWVEVVPKSWDARARLYYGRSGTSAHETMGDWDMDVLLDNFLARFKHLYD